MRLDRVRAEIWLWRHGWAWPLAILLVAAAAILHFSVVKPARHALGEAQAELAQLQAGRGAPAVAPASPALRLHEAREPLRATPPTTAVMQRLVELARAEGITLAQSEYHEQAHASSGMTQLQITQPVRAPYPKLRRYVESVLRELPHASLDQIAARRENVAQGQLEARLRWSFWSVTPEAASR